MGMVKLIMSYKISSTLYVLSFAFPDTALMWHTRHMHTPPPTNLYKGSRFPAEIISHGVWPSCRFCLSYRDVAEQMAERGVFLCTW